LQNFNGINSPDKATANPAPYAYEAVFVLADGLSGQAVLRHSLPLFNRVVGELLQKGWQIAPVVLASQSRVALGDEIGELLGAEQVVMLIGERPGLSAPDSLGVYLTYNPQVGRLESDRNCISNIRPEGLSYQEAANTLLYLMAEARQRKLSGVALKDERDLS
jgi:ethanolamine ammonia-lyase small subunit